MKSNRSARDLLKKAKELYQQGKLEESFDYFQQLLLVNETRSEAYYGLGLIEYNRKRNKEALDLFTVATQIDSLNANAYYYKGIILKSEGNLESAQIAFRSAVSANPNHEAAKREFEELGNSTHATSLGITTQSGFYELLSSDKSPAGKRALALVLDLNFTIKPTIDSHFGSILCNLAKKLPAILFMGVWGNGAIFIGSTILYSIIVDDFPRGLDEFQYNVMSLSIPLALFIVAAIAITSTFLGILSAKNTIYEFDKGRIKITSGAFSKKTILIEMYRITGVDILQDWFNQITGDQTLIIEAEKSNYKLPGIARNEEAYLIQDKLREVAIALRTLPYIKGFII